MVEAVWQSSDYAALACGDGRLEADKRPSSSRGQCRVMVSSLTSLKGGGSGPACWMISAVQDQ